ncbi:aspartate/glutamate racemase family protein [Bradyrhizobium sp. BR 10261]|uniref:aspartate/glutamate racemase family protein n=1 Tax=Bradyrhizobium sp. BR 10261 TaxID=2749992 RepID=UPI001C645055|nr:amino acid racemase [Bradyrhizobium sp. BR 10261]MBW7967154.1 aspartate/glutamate racemase family protein [Bradyrhizobium sp. BR 10261]
MGQAKHAAKSFWGSNMLMALAARWALDKGGRMIGVLGGMGPVATVDFLNKMLAATPARTDQEHVPFVTYSDPAVPDRSTAIRDGRAPSPLPRMVNGVRALEKAGADLIAIPCNTAHYWYDQLTEATSIPVLDMVALASKTIAADLADGAEVGILATRGTLAARLYQKKLEQLGLHPLEPAPDRLCAIDKVVSAVKANQAKSAASTLKTIAAELRERGAHAIALGCTELPVCWHFVAAEISDFGIPIIDPTTILAEECVRLELAIRRRRYSAAQDMTAV